MATNSTNSNASKPEVEQQNDIFIRGLPVTMPEQELFAALSNTFEGVGPIKRHPKTKELWILLLKDQTDRSKMSGRAIIKFQKEESVMKAIEKYNRNFVPILNTQIFVQKADSKAEIEADPKAGKKAGPKSEKGTDSKAEIEAGPKAEIEADPKAGKKAGSKAEKGTDSKAEIEADPKAGKKAGPKSEKGTDSKAEIEAGPKAGKKAGPKSEKGTDSKAEIEAGPKAEIEADPKAGKKAGPHHPKPKLDNPSLPLPATEVNVWALCEGLDATRIVLKSTAIIDDLKKAALGGRDSSNLYYAYYRNRQLGPGEIIPLYTTSEDPVIIRKIVHGPVLGGPPIIVEKPSEHIPKNFHILIDNSNVMISAKTIRNLDGSWGKNPAVRVNVKKLVDVLEKGKLWIEIRTRIAVGSTPRTVDTDPVWIAWKDCLYACIVVEKKGPEDLVDNALHAEGFKVICSNDIFGKQQVLVLATGDGNKNKGQTKFPELVEAALIRGWNVELWSWEQSLNGIYIERQKQFPDRMTINYLDVYRKQITFLQHSNEV